MTTRRMFTRPQTMGPQWLLLCTVLIASVHGQSPASLNTPSSTRMRSSTSSPHRTSNTPQAETSPQTTSGSARTATVSTTTSTTTVNGGGLATNSAWLNGILALASTLSSQAGLQGNNSQRMDGLLRQLPGLVQGFGGVSLQGNDAAQLLASLFSDPRAAEIPAWIEALMAPGSNTSQSLQDSQTLLQSSQQDPNDQVQALLAKVFTDVTQGLPSLDVTANSTSQDIISAILNDPGLMSSLSSDAQQMMGVMGGSEVLQQLLQQQFPVDPDSQCGADLSALGSGLQQGDMWALKMLDATGKLQAGLLKGQLRLSGDYDECVDISHVNGSHTIHGQLCGVAMAAPAIMDIKLPMSSLILHVCLPKSCATEEQVYFLLKPTIGALQSELQGAFCYLKPDPTGDSVFTGTIVTVGVLILLCAAGTACGAILDCKKDTRHTSLVTVTSNDTTNDAPNNNVCISNTHTKGDGGFVKDALTRDHINNNDTGTVKSGTGKSQNQLHGVTVHNTAALGEAKQAINEENLPSQLLLSFSVLRNGRKVLNCDKNSADISCLHGIRVLSITWVVLGHSFTAFYSVQANASSTSVMVQYFTYTAIVSGVLAVDTFFVLSGFLSAFLFLRTTKKTGHLTVRGVVLYYIHRIWRLTPLYGLVLLVYMGAVPYMMEGPYQLTQARDTPTCRDYWYFNLLYVNNLIDLDKMCFGWSWYLSNDMQFSFLAPLVLIPWCLRGRIKIIGFILTAAMVLTHCVTTGILVYTKQLRSYGANLAEYMTTVYYKPWCRIGPYAVGLLLGYILHATRGKYTMTKMSVFLGWTMAAAVGLTLVYIPYDDVGHILTEGSQWGAAGTAAYESLCRVLWAVCVSWVVFACTTGYGGFVNTLMSWSAWAPLSRLSYGVFLLHPIVINVLAGNMKKPLYMDGWTVTELHLAVTVLSFLISFVFSMLVEAPTLGLEKAVLGRIFGKRK